MACVTALCRRLKQLLTVERKNEDAEVARTRDKNYQNDCPARAAKIDGAKGKMRSKGKLSMRDSFPKKLRFNSSQSCSKESSCEACTAACIPKEVAAPSQQTRYSLEFEELGLLGSGEFGSVYRCLHRLDGCEYAVKRSAPLMHSKFAQRRATNEVQANARLNQHRHVVRYYSAWLEADCVNIQQEYCAGGDLAALIIRYRENEIFIEEAELHKILRHIAEGLRYIHGTQLAHLDIKPENILIARERAWVPGKLDSEPGMEVVYKIGDLGHVTSTAECHEPEDEGDCRYLPREILREEFTDLTKADVFALGLTIYEAGGGGPLPKNGLDWHSIRDGNIERLNQYSDHLNRLIKTMIDRDPEKRPSATEILQHEFLSSRRG